MIVVVRQNMPLAYQAVQAGHALADFAIQHPNKFDLWHTTSNYLAFLSVPDEAALIQLAEKAVELGVTCVPFREPDIGNTITAIAFEATKKTRSLTGNLPLMRKEVLDAD